MTPSVSFAQALRDTSPSSALAREGEAGCTELPEELCASNRDRNEAWERA